MATRFPRRARAHSLRSGSTGSVPPLVLKRLDGNSGSSDTAGTGTSDDQRATPTSMRSTPTPGSSARLRHPACPKCKNDRKVHRIHDWTEHGCWIFSCSFMHPVFMDSVPARICGHIFSELKGSNECNECGLILNLECHGGNWGYHCKNYAEHEKPKKK